MTNTEILEAARIDTTDHTVPELKALAKILGVTGYSKLRKTDLAIAVIKAQQEIIAEHEKEQRSAQVASDTVALDNAIRIHNYQKQNGSVKLTPKQRRRAGQKGMRAVRIFRNQNGLESAYDRFGPIAYAGAFSSKHD
jgi:tRNA G10  N-methylase Trm11